MPGGTVTKILETILAELGQSLEATTQYVLNKGHLGHFILWRKALGQTMVTINLCREKNSALRDFAMEIQTSWSIADPRGCPGERVPNHRVSLDKRARKALGLLRRWESKLVAVEEPKPKRGSVHRWGSVDLVGEQIDNFLRLRRQIVTATIRIDGLHQDTGYVVFNQGFENLLEPLDKSRHTFTRLIKFVRELAVIHGEDPHPVPSAGNY